MEIRSSLRNHIRTGVLAVGAAAVLCVLSGCATIAGHVDKPSHDASFNTAWSGLWHGAIALLIALYDLLNDLFRYGAPIQVFDASAGFINHFFWVCAFVVTNGGIGVLVWLRIRSRGRRH